MDEMEIVLLSTGIMKSGKEATSITINNFAKELVNLGNKVTIISEQREEKHRKDTIKGVTHYRIGWFKHFNFYNRILGHALGIRKMQKSMDAKFDVIHNFSSASLLVLRGFFAKLFARKAILVHTMKSYSRNKWGRSFYFILNLADVITVPTKVFAQKLIKNGVKKRKIRIIHSHVNTGKFVAMDKNKLKKKYGYRNKKIIFYYGAMWKIKGSNYLIDAIPQIVRHNKNVQFIFAPRNIDWRIKGYKEDIKRMRVENFCEFILKDIKINEYVAMADVIVLPYPNLIGTEGNPSCMLEAMASKTPVVTTNLAELREIVEHDKDVLMAKPKDAGSLAKEINRLLLNRTLQKKLAENAYKKSKQFDVKLITKEFIRLYKKLII